MRADRLLSILLLLHVNRRMTSRELAERLEVSERTIHRDMEALSAAGIPLFAERGTGGGWFLPEGYQPNLTALNKNEIQTIFLTNPTRLLQDLGLEGASEAAYLKLFSALPPVFRRDAEYARQRIHVDGAGWHSSAESVPHLRTLLEAVWEERKVTFSYKKEDELVERLADPLGLVAKGSAWYLVAAVDGDLRTYRVSRVIGATITDQSSTRPESFDLAAYWEQSMANFKANLPRYPAVIRVAPSVWSRLKTARYVQIERAETPDENGWRKLAADFETLETACEYALGFGPLLEVIEPAELREKVIDLAEQIVAMYEPEATKNDYKK